jgi:hypothetical protein
MGAELSIKIVAITAPHSFWGTARAAIIGRLNDADRMRDGQVSGERL